jgi:hypothetical protein
LKLGERVNSDYEVAFSFAERVLFGGFDFVRTVISPLRIWYNTR